MSISFLKYLLIRKPKLLIKIIVNYVINLNMDKLLIKIAAKKILLELTEQEIDHIKEKYASFDEKIQELMKINLEKYKPTFSCSTNSNYQFRKDAFDKNNNEKIIVKKNFFILTDNKNDAK